MFVDAGSSCFVHVLLDGTACAVVSFRAGCLVLYGWAFDVAALKSVLSGFVAIKANTVLAGNAGRERLCLSGCTEAEP